jgi:hypothetical protein
VGELIFSVKSGRATGLGDAKKERFSSDPKQIARDAAGRISDGSGFADRGGDGASPVSTIVLFRILRPAGGGGSFGEDVADAADFRAYGF